MDLEIFERMRAKLSLANMGKPALVGVAVIVVMVAVLAGRNLIGTATATQFELTTNDRVAEDTDEVGASVARIFVHVSGAVASPGLYELESGSRVAAAIDAAGGFTEDASTGSVNLARKLDDGEMVVVQSMADLDAVEAEDSIGESPSKASGLVNINTASASELENLPGIGPSLAERIVSDRTANGSYKTVQDLKRVSGIGDKKYEALESLICV